MLKLKDDVRKPNSYHDKMEANTCCYPSRNHNSFLIFKFGLDNKDGKIYIASENHITF